MDRARKNIPRDMREKDLSGILYDSPVYGGKPNCVSKTIKKDIQVQPIEQCVHDWTCLKDRVHNKGDGKGKYRAYKCNKCKTFKRRYLK